MADAFNLGWHLRRRVLPALVALDGLEPELARVRAVFDLLVGADLDFDLRAGPPFPSNLCEDDAALELAYTFGGRERTGLRYSYEPTCRHGYLKNRYTLFRDRMLSAMASVAAGYDAQTLQRAFRVGVPYEQLRDADTTVTIAAVHHYRDRAPRLKAYFSCDYQDASQARRRARELVGVLAEPALDAQTGAFFRSFRPQGGVRMVGLDFEPGRPVAVKVYKTGDHLSAPGLRRLVAAAGGGAEARQGLVRFQEIFLEGRGAPADFDLVACALHRGRAPGLKLYIRPVDHYGDGEALRRLRRWFGCLDRRAELEQVERGLAVVAPLDLLDETRGFFNYISVDVGPDGVAKTSVYYAPQIPLARLAHQDPGALERLARSAGAPS